jgi:HEPN domain-containing protein
MASDRAHFQRLAELRLAEARILAREGQFSGAYYIAGYAIECALKARIAALFRENEIPDRNLVNRVYTHDLTALLNLSGLEKPLRETDKATRSWIGDGQSSKRQNKLATVLGLNRKRWPSLMPSTETVRAEGYFNG